MEAILSIPISAKLLVDHLIWVETNNGGFSIRSVYKVAMCLHQSGDVASAQIVNNGHSRRNYGIYLSHTRCAILLGELVVTYSPLKRTYVNAEYYKIVSVTNVVHP